MKKFSFSRILSLIVGGAIFGICLSTLAATVLYRGLNAASNGKVDRLTNRSFRFDPARANSAVLELSTFDSISAASAATAAVAAIYPNSGIKPHRCYLMLETAATRASSVLGPVSGLPGYNAVFDGGTSIVGTASRVPDGHWSIVAPSGVAADAAGSAVVAYAQQNSSAVLVNTPQVQCRW